MSGILLNFSGVSAASVPGAPTIGTATVTGGITAAVSFTAPASDGGSAITSYTATSSPGGVTGTLNQAGSGTINVTGLTRGTAYTFTVTATNNIGTSAASAASNSITPSIQQGEMWACGRNRFYMLGISGRYDNERRSSPVQVGASTSWTNAAVGYETGVAVSYTGKIYTSGRSNYGQCGRGSTTTQTVFTQVGALTTWYQAAIGFGQCFAVKTDGTLWAWGNGSQGALGQNNETSRSSPVQIGTNTNWLQVTAQARGGAAVTTDGKLFTWGENGAGQLGLGDAAVSRSSPVQVGALTNWKRVNFSATTGGAAVKCMAIKTDGTLWGWGSGSLGGTGLGDNVSRSSPVQVGSLTSWANVAGSMYGGSISIANKTDGTLWAWGAGNNGKLGTGNTTTRYSPVQVGALTNWNDGKTDSVPNTKISAQNGTHVITASGTIFSWGYGQKGNLGIGNDIDYNSPKQVGALTTWVSNGQGGSGYSASFLCIKTP
jgi:alpha-tubulin suppressor-like RCC1 family protein